MATILRVTNLTKQYGNLTAVNHISFEIAEGEVVSLLGPNGAGKTTTIQTLLTLVLPTSGDIEIFGKKLESHREELLSMMNFTAPYSLLPYNLTTREALTVFALLYGVRDYKKRVKFLIDEFDLNKLADKKIGRLSSGEQMRIGMAKAFVNNPRLLLLNEPTASLDPIFARQLRGKVLRLVQAAGGAILWTSHNIINVFASPLKLRELVLGFIFVGVTEALLAFFYIVPIALLVYSLRIWDMGLYIIPFFMNTLIFGWGLGVLTIGLVVRFGPSAEILAFFIPFLLLPFSAVYYPISIFPSVLQRITFIIPTRHMFEGMRIAITQGVIPHDSLLWGSVLNLVYLLLGYLFLLWMLKLARTKGYLSRLVQD